MTFALSVTAHFTHHKKYAENQICSVSGEFNTRSGTQAAKIHTSARSRDNHYINLHPDHTASDAIEILVVWG